MFIQKRKKRPGAELNRARVLGHTVLSRGRANRGASSQFRVRHQLDQRTVTQLWNTHKDRIGAGFIVSLIKCFTLTVGHQRIRLPMQYQQRRAALAEIVDRICRLDCFWTALYRTPDQPGFRRLRMVMAETFGADEFNVLARLHGPRVHAEKIRRRPERNGCLDRTGWPRNADITFKIRETLGRRCHSSQPPELVPTAMRNV